MSKKKSLVFDASILLHDPEIFHHYPNHHFILPSVVLEELDRKKNQADEIGKQARHVMRFIDNASKQGDIQKGVDLANGSQLRIILDEEHKKKGSGGYQQNTPDRARHRLLAVASDLQTDRHKVLLVSKDPVTKILAETIGIETSNYKTTKENFASLYQGVRKLMVPKSEIDLFYLNGSLPLPEGDFCPNEYCILKCEENSSAICRVDARKKQLVALTTTTSDVWGIKPKNVEQKCAIDLLLRDEVKLVTFVGSAGTGKTLLALAAGLRKVFDENVYTKIIIARSIMPLGRDIGFLPGNKEEKLASWLAPFFDNLDYICTPASREDSGAETKKWILESDKFQVEAITYMRGRSFANTYIIIDEAQNLTPHEMKTIISRVGENTKIIVLGDPTQIDNPYLDVDSNGLVYLIGRLKKSELFGSIYFKQSERSKLAALAADLL